jgi:hypothetical protein
MTGMPQVCTARGCGEKPVARRLCRKHYQQAWKAGKLTSHKPAQKRQVNRTVCPPEHKHGQNTTCYVLHQCRCDDCTDNRTAREAQRRKLKAYGRYDTGLVDVTEVREHVLMLGEFGIGYKRVAALAGFKSSTPVRTIIWGRQDPGPRFGEMQKRVKRETAEKILAIQPDLSLLADPVAVPSRPYVRMIKALVALGWSQSKIAAELGMSRANFDYVRQYDQKQASGHGSRARMGAGTARAIVSLYADWSMRRPPEDEWRDKIAAARSRSFAAERGWPMPMDWEAIDNDFHRPNPVRRSA